MSFCFIDSHKLDIEGIENLFKVLLDVNFGSGILVHAPSKGN